MNTSTTTFPPTIRSLIDWLSDKMPPWNGDTVDTIKCGNADRQLTGVVTTFIATADVLTKAKELGANLVITHEPTFYQHDDAMDWLKDDPVFSSKRGFLETEDIVVWRLHDGIHRHSPDGILAGVCRELGWEASPEDPALFNANGIPLRDLIGHLKNKLGISMLKYVGDDSMRCHRIGMLVGAAGGRRQMEMLRDAKLDVMICGESPEWETCEYVRDANFFGHSKALIVLGHANSEEPGMRWFAEWLREHLPAEIPLAHLAAGYPFRFA